jgi:Fe-S cluster assembly protein SufD
MDRAVATEPTSEAAGRVFKPGPEAVDMLAELYDEPAWMVDARHDALDLYQEMPLPAPTDEAWRRTSLKKYPLDTTRLVFSPQELDGIYDIPPCWSYALAPVEQVSGVLVHCNGAHTYSTMRRDDEMNGVIFDDLHSALRDHGDLIREHWMRGTTTRPDFNKFTALNAALWHGGTFVYVPENVRVARPLHSLVAHDAQSGTGLHHTLMIAGKGSRVTLIQDRVSRERQDELNAEVVEIYAEEDAWVRYVSLQHWGDRRYSVSVQDAQLQRGANFLWVSGSMGGQMTKDFMRSDLRARHARSMMVGFSFMRARQHLDQSTYQHHRASQTYSDLLFRNVLRDRARSVFYGMIRVETEAGGNTQGYQVNNNLLLDDARAHAIPGLEIIADDVRCSHGATVSRVDPEQRFYLQARGIPRPDAERLVVQGFIRPVVERVPLAHMRQRLEEEITHRFWE